MYKVLQEKWPEEQVCQLKSELNSEPSGAQAPKAESLGSEERVTFFRVPQRRVTEGLASYTPGLRSVLAPGARTGGESKWPFNRVAEWSVWAPEWPGLCACRRSRRSCQSGRQYPQLLLGTEVRNRGWVCLSGCFGYKGKSESFREPQLKLPRKTEHIARYFDIRL